MQTRLYLHIGYPKTGTTSIQAALYANRHHLLEQSILYPESAVALPEKGHHNLPRSLSMVAGIPHHLYRAELGSFEELQCEIHATRPQKAIVSSEGLQHVVRNDPALFRTLVAEHFGTFDTCIVVFVRRADDYLESMFLQRLRDWYADRHDNQTPKLPTYVERMCKDPSGHLRAIFQVMQLPFDLIVRMHSADSVTDMLDILGFDGELEGSVRRNDRLGIKQATLIYLLSSSDKAQAAKRQIRANPHEFKQLLAFQNDTYRYQLLTEDQAALIVAGVQESYAEIARRTGTVLQIKESNGHQVASLSPDVFSEDECRSIENFFGFDLSLLTD